MEAPLFRAPRVWNTKAQPFSICSTWDLPTVANFCDPYSENYIQVMKRIGSESSEGEVYEILCSHSTMALKLLPISSDKDLLKNAKEIEIAKLASRMVIDGRSRNFPKVYGSGRCADTYFFSDRWRGADLKVPADFLVSELAREDLSSWATEPHTSWEWMSIIGQVLETIEFMQSKMQLCHFDLHWGNILVNDGRALIHDFGRSDVLSEENTQHDVKKFLMGWTGENYQLPDGVRDWFRNSDEIIREDGSITDLFAQ